MAVHCLFGLDNVWMTFHPKNSVWQMRPNNLTHLLATSLCPFSSVCFNRALLCSHIDRFTAKLPSSEHFPPQAFEHYTQLYIWQSPQHSTKQFDLSYPIHTLPFISAGYNILTTTIISKYVNINWIIALKNRWSFRMNLWPRLKYQNKELSPEYPSTDFHT